MKKFKSIIHNCFNGWLEDWDVLFTDDLISYYSFFTVIFAEIAYLWAFTDIKNLINITMILFCYIANVIGYAYIRCISHGFIEKISHYLYVGSFVFLFIIGCLFNWLVMVVTTVIAFGITALWIQIREHQSCEYVYFEGISKVTYKINRLFRNKYVWVISQAIVVGGPFILFTIFLVCIPGLPIYLKIGLPILHIILSPLFAFIEDEFAPGNVFELAKKSPYI